MRTMVLTVTIEIAVGLSAGKAPTDSMPDGGCPAQMISPLYFRNAVIQIVGHLGECSWRTHIARAQAKSQPEPIDEGCDSEGYGFALVRWNEWGKSADQIRPHSGMYNALDAG